MKKWRFTIEKLIEENGTPQREPPHFPNDVEGVLWRIVKLITWCSTAVLIITHEIERIWPVIEPIAHEIERIWPVIEPLIRIASGK
jgi:hypothetical protein